MIYAIEEIVIEQVTELNGIQNEFVQTQGKESFLKFHLSTQGVSKMLNKNVQMLLCQEELQKHVKVFIGTIWNKYSSKYLTC